jgi:hypothetical protein
MQSKGEPSKEKEDDTKRWKADERITLSWKLYSDKIDKASHRMIWNSREESTKETNRRWFASIVEDSWHIVNSKLNVDSMYKYKKKIWTKENAQWIRISNSAEKKAYSKWTDFKYHRPGFKVKNYLLNCFLDQTTWLFTALFSCDYWIAFNPEFKVMSSSICLMFLHALNINLGYMLFNCA